MQLLFYATEIYEDSGLSEDQIGLATVGVGGINVIMTVIAVSMGIPQDIDVIWLFIKYSQVFISSVVFFSQRVEPLNELVNRPEQQLKARHIHDFLCGRMLYAYTL